MRILHTIAGLWTTTGGPAASVPALCAALADRGHEVTLLTGDGNLSSNVQRLRSVRLVTVSLGPYRLANYSAEFGRLSRSLARESEVLHTHGLWLHPNFATSRAAREADKPIVISPRGMLAPWALEQRKMLKRLMWSVVQRQYLADADLIHVTSDEEGEEVRRAGITSPLAVVPNGVDLTEFPLSQLQQAREPGRRRVILFLSRVHPKKGIDLLLDAWRDVSPRHTDAKLIIAGPGEPQHIEALRAELKDGRRLSRAEYIGLVEGVERSRLLATATAVVLPSRNENYGMVVAEALASGTPVITTTNVPWPEINRRRCGWRVQAESVELGAAIDTALSVDSHELDAMGDRGRRLIEESHSTAAAAQQMEAAYLSISLRRPVRTTAIASSTA